MLLRTPVGCPILWACTGLCRLVFGAHGVPPLRRHGCCHRWLLVPRLQCSTVLQPCSPTAASWPASCAAADEEDEQEAEAAEEEEEAEEEAEAAEEEGEDAAAAAAEEEQEVEAAAEDARGSPSKRRTRRKPSQGEPQRRQTRSQDAAAERGGRGKGRARG